jgi:hypothetical protein
MTEAILRLQQVASTNEICSHCVSKPVEAGTRHVSFVPELGEPVTHSAGRQPPTMVKIPREQPLTEFGRADGSLTPSRFAGRPKLDLVRPKVSRRI